MKTKASKRKEQFERLKAVYIGRIVDGMDTKSLCEFVADTMAASLKTYTEEQLLTEINEYYPDLIAEVPA